MIITEKLFLETFYNVLKSIECSIHLFGQKQAQLIHLI